MKAGVVHFPFILRAINPCIRIQNGLNIFGFGVANIINQPDCPTKLTIIEDSVQIGCFKHHFKMAGGILFNFRQLLAIHVVDHSFMIYRDVVI